MGVHGLNDLQEIAANVGAEVAVVLDDHQIWGRDVSETLAHCKAKAVSISKFQHRGPRQQRARGHRECQ